jgi:hypothetical protein
VELEDLLKDKKFRGYFKQMPAVITIDEKKYVQSSNIFFDSRKDEYSKWYSRTHYPVSEEEKKSYDQLYSEIKQMKLKKKEITFKEIKPNSFGVERECDVDAYYEDEKRKTIVQMQESIFVGKETYWHEPCETLKVFDKKTGEEYLESKRIKKEKDKLFVKTLFASLGGYTGLLLTGTYFLDSALVWTELSLGLGFVTIKIIDHNYKKNIIKPNQIKWNYQEQAKYISYSEYLDLK